MVWETTVEPVSGLVTLAAAQEHLGLPPVVASGEVDPGVQLRLDAVTEMLDGPDSLTGRCFLRRSIRVTWTGWPSGKRIVPGGVRPTVTGASYAGAPTGGLRPLPAAGMDWSGPFVLFPELKPRDFLSGVRETTLDYQAGNDVVPADVKVLALALLSEVDEHRSTVLGVGEGLGVPSPAMRAVLGKYQSGRMMSPAWTKATT